MDIFVDAKWTNSGSGILESELQYGIKSYQ